MLKKILSVFLAFCMVLSMMPLSVAADDLEEQQIVEEETSFEQPESEEETSEPEESEAETVSEEITESETEPEKASETESEEESAEEPVTEAVSEEETETDSEAIPETEEVTEKATEQETETEQATEQETEKVTEQETEKVTEKETEKVTEKETEKETEKVTEKETEKVTEEETKEETKEETEEETEEELSENGKRVQALIDALPDLETFQAIEDELELQKVCNAILEALDAYDTLEGKDLELVNADRLEILLIQFADQIMAHGTTADEDAAVRAKVKEIAAACRASGANTDYKIARYLHDWLIYHADYDETYTRYTAAGVLLYGSGVCQSYALAYGLLLDEFGIPNKFVSAPEMDHAWNVVQIGGVWTHIDCTWDDPVGGGAEGHHYFCISDAEMAKDHQWNHSAYPACSTIQRKVDASDLKNPVPLKTAVPGVAYVFADANGNYYQRTTYSSGNTMLIYGNESDSNTTELLKEIELWYPILKQKNVHVFFVVSSKSAAASAASKYSFPCVYDIDANAHIQFHSNIGISGSYYIPEVVIQNRNGYAHYYSNGVVNNVDGVVAAAASTLPETPVIQGKNIYFYSNTTELNSILTQCASGKVETVYLLNKTNPGNSTGVYEAADACARKQGGYVTATGTYGEMSAVYFYYPTTCSHSWGSYTSNGANTHNKTCSKCKTEVAENHTWNGTTCTLCKATKGGSMLPTPVVTSLTNGMTGVTVKWNAVSGAAKYRLMYKVGGTWTHLAYTTGTSYTVTGLTSGTTYAFTVRCVSADNQTFTSGVDTVGKSIQYIAVPTISSLQNTATGVTVKWNAVTGAEKYRVMYNSNGTWVHAGYTTGTSYTVTGLTSGTTYAFTVRCVSADTKTFTSGVDTVGKSIKFTGGQLATPVVTSLTNSLTGVTVKWNAVSGAVKYRLMYKVGGTWTHLAYTTGTSYTVTGLTSGTTYAFTVRCVSADNQTFTSGVDTVGKSIQYIAVPTISSLQNTSTGVTVKWNAVTGAEKYRVMYNADGTWVHAGYTTGTSYTVTGLTVGKTYAFTVRCVSGDTKTFTSGVDTVGKSIKYTGNLLATPVVTSVMNTTTGITVKWNAVPGAEKYRVMYNANGTWVHAGYTTGTSYTVTGLTKNTTYAFTVRCVSADTKTFTSAVDLTGKSIIYTGTGLLPTPAVSSLADTPNGVVVKWNAITGAEKYRVMYNPGTGWVHAGYTTGTSFTVTGLTKGKTYAFTVRCVTADTKTFTSGVNTTGKSITFTGNLLATPVVSALTNAATGVKVQWNAVTGAEKYRVMYNPGTGWVHAGYTTGTSFTVTGLTSGTTYAFTVRCVSADTKTFTSGVNTVGKSIRYIAQPVIRVSAIEDGVVTLTWSGSTGADAYRVFYKTGSMDWEELLDLPVTSCNISGMSPGVPYYFTVRCISADGSRYTSSYDTKGVSVTVN